MSNLGIDLGCDNWLTCISNVGTSLIVDGLHFKFLNHFYNKQIANIKANNAQRSLDEKTEERKEFGKRIKCGLYLTSCTILKNGLEARSTKSEFDCGVGVPPARKQLIDIGARSQLYRTANGTKINADANEASNICKKGATTLGLYLKAVSSGALIAPLKVRIWAVQESPSL